MENSVNGCNPIYIEYIEKYVYSCGHEDNNANYGSQCPNRDTCWHVHPALRAAYEQKYSKMSFLDKLFADAL